LAGLVSLERAPRLAESPQTRDRDAGLPTCGETIAIIVKIPEGPSSAKGGGANRRLWPLAKARHHRIAGAGKDARRFEPLDLFESLRIRRWRLGEGLAAVDPQKASFGARFYVAGLRVRKPQVQ